MGLSGREKATIAAVYSALAVVTLVGFVASASVSQGYIVLGGLAVAAYVLGLRHGVDADHIAAIDNTTRKLMQEGKHPLSVGTWFSLGHSTIVAGLVVALTLSTRAIVGSLPWMQRAGAIIGTAVSGTFLIVIGLINLIIVFELAHIFRKLRDGELDDERLDDSLNRRGFMNRYFGKLFRLIEEPWQAYLVGLLFGLGFDTASEVTLIAVSVGVGTTSNIPIWMILVLPLMFGAGMVLVDTTDGISMRFAYGWAFLKPMRKVYYNLTVTVISVLVAFLIGGIEMIQVVANELGLTGGFWTALSKIDFETLGVGVIATFAVSWAVSTAYYRLKGYDNHFAPTGKASPVGRGKSIAEGGSVSSDSP